MQKHLGLHLAMLNDEERVEARQLFHENGQRGNIFQINWQVPRVRWSKNASGFLAGD